MFQIIPLTEPRNVSDDVLKESMVFYFLRNDHHGITIDVTRMYPKPIHQVVMDFKACSKFRTAIDVSDVDPRFSAQQWYRDTMTALREAGLPVLSWAEAKARSV